MPDINSLTNKSSPSDSDNLVIQQADGQGMKLSIANLLAATRADIAALQAQFNSYIPLSQKGAAGGVASLGDDGKVPAAQLPAASSGGSSIPANVKMLLTVNNGQIVDLAGKSFTLANVSAVNGAIYFAGNGSIQYAQSPDFNLGTQDFCIEYLWQHVSSSQYSQIFNLDGADYPLAIYCGSLVNNNQMSFAAGSSSAWSVSPLLGGSPNSGAYSHYAFTRSGSTWRGFKDGTLIDTKSSSGSISNATTPTIGTGGGHSMTGYLKGIKLTVGSAVYTANFTPPSSLV